MRPAGRPWESGCYGSAAAPLRSLHLRKSSYERLDVPLRRLFEEVDLSRLEHLVLELVQPGSLSEEEFDKFVRDTVNFLDYIGEPMQRERRALGIRVIVFLLVLLLIVSMLKREIWRDVE